MMSAKTFAHSTSMQQIQPEQQPEQQLQPEQAQQMHHQVHQVQQMHHQVPQLHNKNRHEKVEVI